MEFYTPYLLMTAYRNAVGLEEQLIISISRNKKSHASLD